MGEGGRGGEYATPVSVSNTLRSNNDGKDVTQARGSFPLKLTHGSHVSVCVGQLLDTA